MLSTLTTAKVGFELGVAKVSDECPELINKLFNYCPSNQDKDDLVEVFNQLYGAGLKSKNMNEFPACWESYIKRKEV